LAQPRVVEPPELGPLVLWVPSVFGATQREDPFLGAALFFVAPGFAEGRIETAAVERLLQGRGLHNRGMQCRARGDRIDTARPSLLVGMDKEIDAEPARGILSKRDHLAELPSGI